MTETLGRLLIAMGLLAVLAGAALLVVGKLLPPGRLPGDFVIRREGFTLYLPLASALLVSLVLTVVLNLVFRIFRG